MSVETSNPACWRGGVMHAILPEIIGDSKLLALSDDKLLAHIKRLIRRTGAYREFAHHRPEVSRQMWHEAWIAKCCLEIKQRFDAWKACRIINEPDLGAITLPSGYNLRFGMPDFAFRLPELNGGIALEVKTGAKITRPRKPKVMRYQLGMLRFTQERQLPALRSIFWLSFHEHKKCPRTARWLPSLKHNSTLYEIPLRLDVLSDWCLGTYGLKADELLDTQSFKTMPTHEALLKYAT